MDFIVETMDPAFRTTDKLGELVDRITRMFAVAKGAEIERLPAPKERKRLEGPRKQIPTRKPDPSLDDDIPF